MNYFNYFIKCLIRNFARMLFKPRNFLIVLILLILFLLVIYSPSKAFEGDNSYTDKNNTIKITYDSICSDFIQRLDLANSSMDKTNLINLLKDSNYSYYLYYGNSSGSDMISSSYYQPQYLRIVFYNNNQKTVTGTVYENYQGMSTNISSVGNLGYYYFFNGNSLFSDNVPSSVYIPYVIINYHSDVIVDYLTNSSEKQTNDIIGAINEQTNTIQEQTTVIEQQTEAITSTDFDEDSVDIDTSSADVDNSTESGLFTTIFNAFNNSIQNDSVEYINIPLPNNSGSLSIPSNIVSSHLGGLSLLINAFWLYVFGFYAFKFVNNLLIKIKDGTILDGYTSSEVITSDMV